MFKKIKKIYQKNDVALLTITGVFLGLLFGLGARRLFLENETDSFNPDLLRYLSLPGVIFIRIFMILIVPLLITSLSTSMISHRSSRNEDDADTKKMLLFTVIFFVCTSSFAAMFGMTAVTILKPGFSDPTIFFEKQTPIEINIINGNISQQILRKQDFINKHNQQIDSIFNIVLNIFPNNVFSPMFSTSYQTTKVNWPSNLTKVLDDDFVVSTKIETSNGFRTNMMGVCMLSLVLGMILQNLGPEKSSTIRSLLIEGGEVVNHAMSYLIKFMPIGMFCWMFAEALKMHSIGSIAKQLAFFLMTAFTCFFVILLVVYPLIYYCFVRENPYRLYSRIFPAIMVAFGTTSSAITLPVTIQCMEKDDFLLKNISKMVLGLGMTIHMNGSALYYPMVAVFVSQLKGMNVDITSLFVLCVFAVLMSMGFPGTPAGGAVIVNHIAFASVLGVENPQDVLAFILAFEWIMERLRTCTNIIGDCFVAKCVEARFSSKSQ